MECGIEFFSDSFNGLDSHLVQLIHELSVDLIHSDNECVILVLFIHSRKASFEVVDNGKEFFENGCGSSVEGLCFFLFGTVPEVLKFRKLAFCPVFELCYFGLQLFLFLISLLSLLLCLALCPGFLTFRSFRLFFFRRILGLISIYFSGLFCFLCGSCLFRSFSHFHVLFGSFLCNSLSGIFIDNLVSIFFTHYL